MNEQSRSISSPSSDALIAKAKALAPLARNRGQEAEQLGRVHDDTFPSDLLTPRRDYAFASTLMTDTAVQLLRASGRWGPSFPTHPAHSSRVLILV